jgi:hypothetical protein
LPREKLKIIERMGKIRALIITLAKKVLLSKMKKGNPISRYRKPNSNKNCGRLLFPTINQIALAKKVVDPNNQDLSQN